MGNASADFQLMVCGGPTNYRKTPQDTARHRKTPQDTARHPQDTARHPQDTARHLKKDAWKVI